MQSSFTQKPSPSIRQNATAKSTSAERYVDSLGQWFKQLSGDDSLRNRTLTHVTMLAVVLLVIGLSRVNLSWGTISAIRPLKYNTFEPAPPDAEVIEQPFALPSKLRNIDDDVLIRGAVPRTIIPDRNPQSSSGQAAPAGAVGQVRTYSVQPGDNISIIAAKFNLQPETIIWANPELEYNPDILSVGQQLIVLPEDGVYHQVGGGDTIEGIAATFEADPAAIIKEPLNGLDPDNLVIRPGQWLIVPGGRKPFKPRAVTAYSGPVPDDAAAGTGIFGWPASGSITQGFYSYHPGIDIGGWQGEPVLAADSGYVVIAGWDNTGYGLHIVIDHGNGFQTLYAHLSGTDVAVGDNVSKGQQLGEMGCTGNCTGPHLHFEIRRGTVQRNPYGFLP